MERYFAPFTVSAKRFKPLEPARKDYCDTLAPWAEGIDWSVVNKDDTTVLYAASWAGNMVLALAPLSKAG